MSNMSCVQPAICCTGAAVPQQQARRSPLTLAAHLIAAGCDATSPPAAGQHRDERLHTKPRISPGQHIRTAMQHSTAYCYTAGHSTTQHRPCGTRHTNGCVAHGHCRVDQRYAYVEQLLNMLMRRLHHGVQAHMSENPLSPCTRRHGRHSMMRAR
jgi:hypothetical protein